MTVVAAPTLLGHGHGVGHVITVTLTANVPGDGSLMLFWGSAQIGQAGGDNAQSASACTDSKGRTWTLVGTGSQPVLGLVRMNNAAGTDTLYVGSVGRACTAAGDLVIGDTVTLTINSAYPASLDLAVLLVYVPCQWAPVNQRGQVPTNQADYSWGDGWPDDTFQTATSFSYTTRYGVNVQPYPDLDAVFVSAVASTPSMNSFSGGAYLGGGAFNASEPGGVVSVACHVGSANAGEVEDPGGTLGDATNTPELWAFNYQFAAPLFETAWHIDAAYGHGQ